MRLIAAWSYDGRRDRSGSVAPWSGVGDALLALTAAIDIGCAAVISRLVMLALRRRRAFARCLRLQRRGQGAHERARIVGLEDLLLDIGG